MGIRAKFPTNWRDRGPDARDTTNLIRYVGGGAEFVGGELRVLPGIHEVMNVVGDRRLLRLSCAVILLVLLVFWRKN